MKTLTLHIDENIYDEVKNFLVLLSPDKVKIENEGIDSEAFLSNLYLSKKEFEKIKEVFKLFNIPIPENKKIPIAYNDEDLDTDIQNLKDINLLK